MKRWIVLGLALATVAGSAAPRAASAAPAAPALAVGYVDLDVVVPAGTLFKAEQTAVQQKKKELEDLLAREETLAMLTADERKNYDTLKAKATPSDEEKKQIGDLEGKTKRLMDELNALNAITNRDATQNSRLTELTKLYTDAQERLQNTSRTRSKEFDDLMQASWNKVQDALLKAIEAVAKEQGLALVVDKKVRLFGGVDITDAVAKRMAG